MNHGKSGTLHMAAPEHNVLMTTTVVGAMRKDTYLLRYSNLPLRAQFVFYHNGMQWKLTYFLWDDKTQELLN